MSMTEYVVLQHDAAHSYPLGWYSSLFEATCVWHEAIAYGPTFEDDDDEGIELLGEDDTILWHSFS